MASGGSYDPLSIFILVHLQCTKNVFSLLWRRLFALIADLDQQLHGWSIDAIDNHDGCVICLENLSGSQVENCSLSSHVSELMDGDVEVGILNKLVNADAFCKVV